MTQAQAEQKAADLEAEARAYEHAARRAKSKDAARTYNAEAKRLRNAASRLEVTQ